MSSDIQREIQKGNEEYVKTFSAGDLPIPPAKKYLIVTCMDARIHVESAFGVAIGDAHIIRNAGGAAKDALRSIIISEQFLGTKEIAVIKHTDCGMLTFTSEQAHDLVKKNLGPAASAEIANLDFLTFPDLNAAVESDVQYLKRSEAVPKDVVISGWVYNVKTGKINQVV